MNGPEPWHLRTRRFLRATDQRAQLVRAARLVRRLVPGDELPDDPLTPSSSRSSDRIARLLSDAGADRPSATRELGLAAVQAWQAASRRTTHPDPSAGVTILFTDLVGFSSWALHAGDDRVLALLRAVADVSKSVITGHGGSVVKGLGDGVMAVFGDTGRSVLAAHETCSAVAAVQAEGYHPRLRAGLHRGHPHRVGADYFGVDVNIAARVMAAANGDEVLASAAVINALDPETVLTRRRRGFRAKGVPPDLQVYSVHPTYDS
ncbi:adenylate/guanylate cyclase domain-containing protein [Amycolatopsis sp. NPDC051758]|uniref:adenylate/guanylate cyclase domain-containing protein n=1 Tax=Amycolatopsis sp. NPDC051758 TaxID=3363935 RepID=UPI0037953B7F